MQKIAIALLLVSNCVIAQQADTLVSLSSSWAIDPKSKVGATARIPATNQNPFPYCFATAAAMLYDQNQCIIAGKKSCDNSPTSFLAIAAAGQKDIGQGKLSPLVGGSPIKSLEYLLTTGKVLESDCGYTNISILQDVGLYKLTHELKLLHDARNKYWPRAPYLSNYYRYQFKNVVQEINHTIDETAIDQMLTQPFELEKITAQVLLNPKCFTPKKSSRQFQLKFTTVDLKNLTAAQQQIHKLLKQKKPIIVNFCPRLNNHTHCNQDQPLHSLVIIAQAKAVHKITKDSRTVYWVVNSWGESWQEKNTDGWVYADPLLEALVGEIVWLEVKQ